MNTCEVCQKSFERKFDLQRHFKSKKHICKSEGTEVNKDFTCKNCDIEFLNNQRFQKHLQSTKHALAINKDLFKCNEKYLQGRQCSKRFFTNKQLQRHIAEDHFDIQELAEYIVEYLFKNYKLSDKELSVIKNEEYFNDHRKTTLSYFCDLLRNTILNKKLNFKIKGDNQKDNYKCSSIYYNFRGVVIRIPINIQLVVGLINRTIDCLKQLDNFYEDYLNRIVFKDDPYRLNESLYDTDLMGKNTITELINKFKVNLN